MSDSPLLKIAILETLKQFDWPVTEKTIVLSLTVTYSLKPTYTDVRESLKELEEARFIASVNSVLKGVLWGITDKGRLELSAN